MLELIAFLVQRLDSTTAVLTGPKVAALANLLSVFGPVLALSGRGMRRSRRG